MRYEFRKEDQMVGSAQWEGPGQVAFELEDESAKPAFDRFFAREEVLPAYDPLIESSVRHVLTRHEQGAGHAAEGYAWATGKVGVCMATSGPGGCNLVTALADAKMDSVPVVAITGQVPTGSVGNDAFPEADITGITLPGS